MDTQIDYFNITRKHIDELLGTTQARQFVMKKSMFPIVVGSNDILNNYLLPILSAGERKSISPDAFIAKLNEKFNQQLNVSAENPQLSKFLIIDSTLHIWFL